MPGAPPIPASAWSRLVLPLPLGPTRQTSSPAAISSDDVVQPPGQRQAGGVEHHDRQPPAHMRDQPEEEGRAEQGGDHADRQRPAERGEPHGEVGGGQQQRADQRRGQDRPAGMAAGQPPREDRRDQADEADRAADRDAGADAERGQADDLQPQARDVVAERLRHLLAERQPVERRAEPEQQGDGRAAPGKAAKAAWSRLRSISEPISQS